MDESPIPPRTPRRSRYSCYQSDYETAAEDSDSSLYYSLLGDEDKENDFEEQENHRMTSRNGTPMERSILMQCLQKNLNLTPRNTKRVSFNVNPFLPSTSLLVSTATVDDGGIEAKNTSVLATETGVMNEPPQILTPSNPEFITEMFGMLNHTPRNEFNKRVSLNLSPLLPSTSIRSSTVTVHDRVIESKGLLTTETLHVQKSPQALTFVWQPEDITETEADQSMNSTIRANQSNGSIIANAHTPEADGGTTNAASVLEEARISDAAVASTPVVKIANRTEEGE